MKKYYIYEIINNINGKTYIGQHKGELNDNYYGSGTAIKSAIKKYGKKNFTKIILEEVNSLTINDREIYWINLRKNEGKAEYNISGGGQSVSSPFFYKSEEEKKKIFKKSAQSRIGKPSGSTGKRFKEVNNGEHIANFQPCKSRRIIKCNETGQIFLSIRECADVLNISHEAIKDYLDNGRTIPIGGYTFEEINKKIPYVIILETEDTFETVKECAEFIGCNKTSVNKNLSGKAKQCLGYHIMYFKNYNKDENKYLGLPRYNESKQRYTTKKGHSIICIETGEEFKSIIEASKKFNVCKTDISLCCSGKRKTAGGYHWRYK